MPSRKPKPKKDGGRSRRLPNSHFRSREHLSLDEVEALQEMARCYGRNRDRNSALVLLMFRHGLRAVEAAMLEWKDVDLRENTIYIRRVKGSESGTHPLVEDEKAALLKLQPSEHPQIFLNERGESFLVRTQAASSRAPGISRIIERLGKASDLAIKVHAHMLRHACGYWLINRGYDVRLVQEYLGHVNIQHTVRYTKLSPERFREIRW